MSEQFSDTYDNSTLRTLGAAHIVEEHGSSENLDNMDNKSVGPLHPGGKAAHAEPLISIVIPAYNIEDYLGDCLASVCAQTYQNIEIVVVDDGSTDGTLDVCRWHANKDSRIRVFSKPNEGLSATRNYGAQQAVGKYLMYVDGDDLISPDCIQTLYDVYRNNEVQLVVGFHQPFNKEPELDFSQRYDVEVLSSEQLAVRALYSRVGVSWCCKFALRELWLKHPLDVGHVYEDLRSFFWIATDIDRAALVFGAPMYGYRMRPGSTTSKVQVSKKQLRDYWEALESVCNAFAGAESPEIQDGLMFRTALEYTRMFRLADQYRDDPDYGHYRSDIIAYERAHLLQVLRHKKCIPRMKSRVALIALAPKFYDVAYRVAATLAGKRLG